MVTPIASGLSIRHLLSRVSVLADQDPRAHAGHGPCGQDSCGRVCPRSRQSLRRAGAGNERRSGVSAPSSSAAHSPDSSRRASRSPAAANAAAIPSASPTSSPLAISALGQPARTPRQPGRPARSSGAEQVRGDRPRLWHRLRGGPQVEPADLHLDPVRHRVLSGGVDARRIEVERQHRREAERRGGDRQHARAAAEVDEPPRRAGSSSSSSRHSRVVACAPVPNACPGSITTSSSADPAGSHGGRTVRRSPSTSGRWNSRQRSAQSSATSLVDTTSTSAPPAGGPQVRQRRQLARRAVDRVLDHVRVDVDLLDPARRQLQQLGQHQLGVLARGRGPPSRINPAAAHYSRRTRA